MAANTWLFKEWRTAGSYSAHKILDLYAGMFELCHSTRNLLGQQCARRRALNEHTNKTLAP